MSQGSCIVIWCWRTLSLVHCHEHHSLWLPSDILGPPTSGERRSMLGWLMNPVGFQRELGDFVEHLSGSSAEALAIAYNRHVIGSYCSYTNSLCEPILGCSLVFWRAPVSETPEATPGVPLEKDKEWIQLNTSTGVHYRSAKYHYFSALIVSICC